MIASPIEQAEVAVSEAEHALVCALREAATNVLVELQDDPELHDRIVGMLSVELDRLLGD